MLGLLQNISLVEHMGDFIFFYDHVFLHAFNRVEIVCGNLPAKNDLRKVAFSKNLYELKVLQGLQGKREINNADNKDMIIILFFFTSYNFCFSRLVSFPSSPVEHSCVQVGRIGRARGGFDASASTLQLLFDLIDGSDPRAPFPSDR